MMRRSVLARAAAALAVCTAFAACGDADTPPARPAARPDSVTLVFSRNEAPVRVTRRVEGEPDLRAALALLVRGPTSEERAEAIWSWFSDSTANVINDVQVDPAGHAIIDFHDLRPLIPGASSSAGSTMLLQELNGTVFQFPQIQSVQYRMNGSCDAFWEWLQYACQTVERADVPPAGG